MATIDELTLQLKANTTPAVNGIDRLTESLKRLQSATSGGLGLKACTKEMSAFSSASKDAGKSADSSAKSNKSYGSSFSGIVSKAQIAFRVLREGVEIIGDCVKKSSDYIENINLFNVSMGKFADEARNYAESVGEIMGIDPGEWMKSQGVFMTLATGFGVAGERANVMSKNLTQLGYDLSSFFNISQEDAMAKLQSGLAGELEPLRRIGFDLSQARLQQEAYTLGINKKVSAMTQAEKAELRYHAILTQVTTAQGDMARTLESPSNQFRILSAQVEQAARAIGNLFIPVLQAVLPYIIAFVKMIRYLAESMADFFGIELPIADTSGIESMASGAEDASDALGSAADNAKKLKKHTLGLDELNVIDPTSGSSGSGSGAGIGGGFNFELPEYDFLGGATESKANAIVEKFKELLPTTDEVKKRVEKIVDVTGLDTLGEGAIEGMGNLKEAAGTAGEILKNVWEENKTGLVQAAENAGIAVTTTTDVVTGITTDMFTQGTANVGKFLKENQGEIEKTTNKLVQTSTKASNTVSKVVTDSANTADKVWEERGSSTFDNICTSLGDLGETIMNFYNTIIDPVINKIVDGVSWLWDEHLSPLWENICEFFSQVGDFISVLWSNVLKPFVDSIVNILGPHISNAITDIWNVICTIAGLIADVISGIIRAIGGILDFITGIFSGDWEKAWNGIKDIFGGIWDAIWGIIKGVINLLIDALNGTWKAIAEACISLINAIGDVVKNVGAFFGKKDWGWRIEPKDIPVIPKLADGGLVDAGQMFIAREAGPELVGNIGRQTAVANNDQIVDGIAKGVSSANSESNMLLREQNSLLREMLERETGVYLDGKEISKSVERHQRERGRVLVTGGAY